ncbi:GNAT family N-acetyltransferase [Coxiella burnetii]|uniref:Acetyltransferase n=2 Tax=Coxiella burnetii TaxID=777 RepID=A9KEX2_COXBN|nr:GNAT family N-acetyltransferase [Coxiella burnetii]ABS78312.1 acetyltransferase [Coxiella burnetii Dugway 5J108-111]ACJ19416.1 acetyltransferase [Coxiella burnetii CbuK_Q154]EAX33991.1 GNAT family N-acetyltransferase [Coxiella burnetii 'MSU Goat Q177']OYK81092.1 N-acetyltransferase [Coxiella burnetii]OYK83183.1 N-acetyltransferase [Coxiella burnetii]
MKNYYFSNSKRLLKKNKEKVCRLLKDCFWSKDIPIEYVERFIEHSFCFGIYEEDSEQLVGFGRVISDYTTYAYICDVVIDPRYRRNGLGKALIDEMFSHPKLQGLKTWSLRTTEEARKIYEKKGFRIAKHPETLMEIDNLEIYTTVTHGKAEI